MVYRTARRGRSKKIEQQRAQEQTITRKLREARIAIQLEQKMTKEEILTGYLNVVEFADRVYGVGAAAQAYFNTTPDKLTVAQAALLAGMVNNPSLYNPWKRPERDAEAAQPGDRQDGREPEAVAEDAAEAAKKEPLGVLPDSRTSRPPTASAPARSTASSASTSRTT